jgi:hypothetical protein
VNFKITLYTNKISHITPVHILRFYVLKLKMRSIKKHYRFKGFFVYFGQVLLLMSLNLAQADIHFEELNQGAGIVGRGTTFGASWGDFNGDGWPDLWVGNHNTAPNLYLNQQDGTFKDIINSVWSADPEADTHGAAWADFDNDGDQDLVELVDVIVGDLLCLGCGRNHLFVNEEGRLHEKAKELGLSAPLGQGRTPLWFDADGDGQLDILVTNREQHGKGPSILYQQELNRFEVSNKKFNFRPESFSRRDYIEYLASKIIHLQFQKPTFLHINYNLRFAQLADLTGNEHMELIRYGRPTRVYSIEKGVLEDITGIIGFPEITDVSDAAIEDFNGDAELDVYLAIGPLPYSRSDVIQTDQFTINGTISGHKPNVDKRKAKAVHFQTDGEVNIQIYPTWFSLSRVFIGNKGENPLVRTFTLSPNDPDVKGPTSSTALKWGGLSIEYDPATLMWSLRNSQAGALVDFIVHSSRPIEQVQLSGFEAFKEEGVDVLLLRHGNRYQTKRFAGNFGMGTSCHSVVAGDFDNDMDVDLYMVCSGPLKNLPNRLYRNDGSGKFSEVANAAGAAGSELGRGDVAVTADYDQDGFLDIFVTNGFDPTSPFVEQGPHQLFRNQGNDNHWLQIDLEGVISNRDGIGAIITLDAGGRRQIRDQVGGMHLNSQNYQRIHFGLGRNTKVDRLSIRWPSGIVQQLENIKVDQILKIQEQSEKTALQHSE